MCCRHSQNTKYFSPIFIDAERCAVHVFVCDCWQLNSAQHTHGGRDVCGIFCVSLIDPSHSNKSIVYILNIEVNNTIVGTRYQHRIECYELFLASFYVVSIYNYSMKNYIIIEPRSDTPKSVSIACGESESRFQEPHKSCIRV